MREDRVFVWIGRVRCDACFQSGPRLRDDWKSVRRKPAPEVLRRSHANYRERPTPDSKGIGPRERSILEPCPKRRVDFSPPCSSRSDAFRSVFSMQAGPRLRFARETEAENTTAVGTLPATEWAKVYAML